MAAPGVIDRVCRDKCVSLVIQNGNVKLVDQWLNRTVVLGNYAAQARSLVPPAEAPLRSLRSPRGWRIAVSAYLDHEQDALGTHIRFFAPGGTLKVTGDALASVEWAETCELRGANDELFVITSWEEHAYNTQTQIWLLPEQGDSRSVLEMQGTFSGLVGGPRARGLRMLRQTYNGADANTKGTVEELYLWDLKTKSLRLQRRPPSRTN